MTLSVLVNIKADIITLQITRKIVVQHETIVGTRRTVERTRSSTHSARLITAFACPVGFVAVLVEGEAARTTRIVLWQQEFVVGAGSAVLGLELTAFAVVAAIHAA